MGFAACRGKDWKGRALRWGDLLRGQRWGPTKTEALDKRNHDPDPTLPNHAPSSEFQEFGQQTLQAWGGGGERTFLGCV